MPLNHQLRSMWLAAGYPRNMGSQRVTPPPDPSYLRVYHLTSAAHAINSIAMRRLKVSRFSDLNDPYEAMGPMWRRIEWRDRIEKIRDRWNQELGLLCFSSDWISPVLWSHYADRHKGICLGFDVPRSIVRSVDYKATRLDVRVNELASLEKSKEPPQSVLLTKYKHWEYEAEQRVLLKLSQCSEEGALHFTPFGNDLKLAEVILGDLCALDIGAVRALAAGLPQAPIVFRARLAGKSYTVVPAETSV